MSDLLSLRGLLQKLPLIVSSISVPGDTSWCFIGFVERTHAIWSRAESRGWPSHIVATAKTPVSDSIQVLYCLLLNQQTGHPSQRTSHRHQCQAPCSPELPYDTVGRWSILDADTSLAGLHIE